MWLEISGGWDRYNTFFFRGHLCPVYTAPVQLLHRSRRCYGSANRLHCYELSVTLLAPLAGTLWPRLRCTGTTSALEQKVLRFTCVYTAQVQKLYQIALPFTLYRLPLFIKSQYCYCALLKNKIHITCPDD